MKFLLLVMAAILGGGW